MSGVEPDWGGWADELPPDVEELLRGTLGKAEPGGAADAAGPGDLDQPPELPEPEPEGEPDWATTPDPDWAGTQAEPDWGGPQPQPDWAGERRIPDWSLPEPLEPQPRLDGEPAVGGGDRWGVAAFGSGIGGVDAHVDEPLYGADLPDTPAADTGGSWAADAGADDGGDWDVDSGTGTGGDWDVNAWADLPPVPDPPFGADPDAADLADVDGWAGPDFPPMLDLTGLPEPVDGPPWGDPAVIGGEPLAEPAGYGTPDPADLSGYAAVDLAEVDGDPWAALLAADDPATSALARWWAPPAA
ncbi:MAG TPA: hypothetical protein VFM55_00520 [Micromonosporaceae bacterium]|nr:hypothetical protein [Micromonosporaceae bacterium]